MKRNAYKLSLLGTNIRFALSMTAALSALMVLPSKALANQLLVTNGTTATAPDGATYQSFSTNLTTGGAVYAIGLNSTINGTNLTINDGAITGGAPVRAGAGGKMTLTGGSITRTHSGTAILVGTSGTGTTGWMNLSNVNVSSISGTYGVQVNGIGDGTTVFTMTGGELMTGASTWALHLWNGNAILDGVNIENSGSGIHAGCNLANKNASCSVLNVKDSTITATGDYGYGINAESNSTTTLTDMNINTQGDNSWAVYASSSNSGNTATTSRITGNNVNVNTTGAQAHGIVSLVASGSSYTLIDLTGGSVNTAGDSAYGVIAWQGGEVKLTDMQVTTTGPNGRLLHMTGYDGQVNTITIKGGSYTSAQGVAISVRGSDNYLSLTDTTVTSGNGTLFDVDQHATQLTPSKLTILADDTKLNGGALLRNGSTTDLTLQNGSVWTLTPASDVVNGGISMASTISSLAISDSTLAFAAPAGNTDFKTLTVQNNYTASNATLVFNTLMNGGGAVGNQFTDRLIINGDAVGTTKVYVSPSANSNPQPTTAGGGTGSSCEGISLIQVNGQATAASFQLAGGYVAMDGKPYQYRLYAYGPDSEHGQADPTQKIVDGTTDHWDFRLQSAYYAPATEPEDPDNPDSPPAVRMLVPQGAAYLSAPNAVLYAGYLDINSLHRRLGEIRDDRLYNRDTGTGEVWIRGYGGSYDYHSDDGAAGYKYDGDLDYAAVQLGGNLFARRDDAGTLRAGVAVSFGHLRYTADAESSPEGRSDSYSVALYGTYQSQQGWYVDSVLGTGIFDGDVKTNARGKTANLDGSTWFVSLETGYPFTPAAGWSLEPQAQLSYIRAHFDNTHDKKDNFSVSLGDQDQLIGRLGARLLYSHVLNNGQTVTPYVKANVLHGFLDGGHIKLGGDSFSTADYGSSVELGGGVTFNVNNALSLYADAAGQRELSEGYRGWTVNGGLRYQF
ncbi:P.93 [Leminorella grimontii]|nr:P.93 [Leminorella grimontii]